MIVWRNKMEEFKEGKFTVVVEPDPEAESGRDCDNVGVMVCFHKRHNLGDKHSYCFEDFSSWDNMEDHFVKNGLDDEPVAEILPLYLYDHDGITMNTTGFSCRWDSGQVGFIVATRKAVKDQLSISRLTKKAREKIRKALIAEVECYDQFISGDVWCFEIRDEDGEFVEGCGNLYGYDYCVREAKKAAKRQARIQ
jgi:hypothetical protein